MNNFTIKRTPVSNGKKTKFELFCNEVLIGSRTTARPYKFATVTKRDQTATALSYAAGAKSSRAEAAEYQAVIDDAPGARATAARNFPSSAEWLTSGQYAKWVTEITARAARNDAEAIRLSGSPLPEFDTLYVYSWNSKPTNYPRLSAIIKQVAIVNLETIPAHV